MVAFITLYLCLGWLPWARVITGSISYPPYSEIVLTCDDDLENMKGCFAWTWLLAFWLCPHLRRSGSAVCCDHVMHSQWWMPVLCPRDFWVSCCFSIFQVWLFKPLHFSFSSSLFLSLGPSLLCVFPFRAFLSSTNFFLSKFGFLR